MSGEPPLSRLDVRGARLVRQEDVMSKLQVKAVTLWRWRRDGIGPKWCKLGRCVRYLADDVEKFASCDSMMSAMSAATVSHHASVATKQVALSPVVESQPDAVKALIERVQSLEESVQRLMQSRDHLQDKIKRLKKSGKVQERFEPEEAEIEGRVYVISRHDGRMKIGKSFDVEKRLASMRTVLPDLKVLLVLRGYTKLEKTLHDGMESFRFDREWFHANDEAWRRFRRIVKDSRANVLTDNLQSLEAA